MCTQKAFITCSFSINRDLHKIAFYTKPTDYKKQQECERKKNNINQTLFEVGTKRTKLFMYWVHGNLFMPWFCHSFFFFTTNPCTAANSKPIILSMSWPFLANSFSTFLYVFVFMHFLESLHLLLFSITTSLNTYLYECMHVVLMYEWNTKK